MADRGTASSLFIDALQQIARAMQQPKGTGEPSVINSRAQSD